MVFIISAITADYSFEGVKVIRNKKKCLRLEIDRFKPQVIALHYPLYNTISLVNKLKYPVITWIHGHEILWNIQLGSSGSVFNYIIKRLAFFPREFYQKLIIREFLQNTDKNVFVSKWLFDAAQKHTIAHYSNSVIIPNPVDCDLFQYQLPKNISKAICLRGIGSRKYGVDLGIRAFSISFPSDLTIIGTGKYLKKYIRLIRKTDSRARIIGKSLPHNKLPDLYRSYGYFVAPSRIEAQGLAMCEAMSCGLPVISTNVGGIPEFVRDGIDGFLVKKNDWKGIAYACSKLIADKDKYIEMSENARANILKICGAEEIARREINLMNEVILNYYA